MTTLEDLDRAIEESRLALNRAVEAHFSVLADNLATMKIQDSASSHLLALHRTRCQMLIGSLMNHLRDVEPTDGT